MKNVHDILNEERKALAEIETNDVATLAVAYAVLAAAQVVCYKLDQIHEDVEKAASVLYYRHGPPDLAALSAMYGPDSKKNKP